MFKKERTARTTIGDQDIKKYKLKKPIMNLRNLLKIKDIVLMKLMNFNKSKLNLGFKLIRNH